MEIGKSVDCNRQGETNNAGGETNNAGDSDNNSEFGVRSMPNSELYTQHTADDNYK